MIPVSLLPSEGWGGSGVEVGVWFVFAREMVPLFSLLDSFAIGALARVGGFAL